MGRDRARSHGPDRGCQAGATSSSTGLSTKPPAPGPVHRGNAGQPHRLARYYVAATLCGGDIISYRCPSYDDPRSCPFGELLVGGAKPRRSCSRSTCRSWAHSCWAFERDAILPTARSRAPSEPSYLSHLAACIRAAETVSCDDTFAILDGVDQQMTRLSKKSAMQTSGGNAA